ncbi:alpha/beta hydrolase [Oceanimonas baumannii]|uniref:Esterase n=2 Tax=Oceanimonas baumannii TaxID=129578 RepID=A0ABY2EVN3_9GAMM|nr:alpha/beta hydrolase-fold protein [Oceanimonas baumannii]TDW56364.1 hypothetical protein LY04_02986 [Oceanimonas baumannii]
MRYWTMLIIGLLLAPYISAVEAGRDTHYRFEQREFQSKDGEREYEVILALPKAAAPEKGYPVLYMLDGKAALRGLTGTALGQLQGGDWPVLVMIGYKQDARSGRSFDYTPVPEQTTARLEGLHYGGADGFWQLIEQQIKPVVRDTVPVDNERQTLWGHSFGGLFVLHTLFNYPHSYQHYVAADPSLWWQDGQLLSAEKNYRQRGEWPKATLLLQRSSSHRAGSVLPENATREMARRLSRLPGVEVQYSDHFNHDHGSVRDESIPFALRIAQE